MNKEDFFKKHNISKTSWGGSKEIIDQLINLVNQKEEDLEEEKFCSYNTSSKCEDLERKISEYEDSIFNKLPTILNENEEVIGLKDKDGDLFYLEHHLKNKYIKEIDQLKNKNNEYRDKIIVLNGEKSKLKSELNRSKKRFYQSEKTIKSLLKPSGILLLTTEFGEDKAPELLPYKVPSCINHKEGPIAEVCFYKNKFWVHKTDKTNNFKGEILVNGTDLVTSSKKRLTIDFNSKIIVTSSSDYEFPEYEYKLINKNIA